MPVAPVAGESGGVEAQYGPNLSGVQPRHQPLEARPCHHSAGGAAEVVIDYLNLAETMVSRDVNELVLSSLTLEVGLDLRLRRLPNIDHRLALQHRSRQKITARHRHAPCRDAGGLQQEAG
ncbi:hypothetical protein SAMN05444161_9005 [Rhizobiales bacterium GAS191]|nr:hypothetical protein SAMN05444161_9005 [Rhizobiales bacterium GAS191]